MDRFSRGLVSGIAGGVVMNIWSLTAYYILHVANRRFLDWAAVLMYGHLPLNLNETLLAQASQLLWAGFLGVLFAYFMPAITSRHYLLKGAFGGFIAGFLIYASAILLNMRFFNNLPFNTVLTQIIGGALWGLTMAFTLRWLDRIKQV